MTERTATSPGKTPASDETNPRLRLGHALKAKLSDVGTGLSSSSGRKPRRARLRLTRIDPWSVMKTSFLLSVAFGVVTFVAVLVVWTVLSAGGLWDSINDALAPFMESDNGPKFDITDYVGAGRVLGFTLVVAVLDVILLTAIATLMAFLYNLSAALLGGIELTLAEEER
jgi:hypothetical protein